MGRRITNTRIAALVSALVVGVLAAVSLRPVLPLPRRRAAATGGTRGTHPDHSPDDPHHAPRVRATPAHGALERHSGADHGRLRLPCDQLGLRPGPDEHEQITHRTVARQRGHAGERHAHGRLQRDARSGAQRDSRDDRSHPRQRLEAREHVAGDRGDAGIRQRAHGKRADDGAHPHQRLDRRRHFVVGLEVVRRLGSGSYALQRWWRRWQRQRRRR